MPWTSAALAEVEARAELRISTARADGSPTAPVPIWVVRVDDEVYVRSWHRRSTGWFGRALRRPHAHVSVGSLDADVLVDDLGKGSPALRAAVDAAYRRKYGAGADSMVTDAAAATTLRLRRVAGH